MGCIMYVYIYIYIYKKNIKEDYDVLKLFILERSHWLEIIQVGGLGK